MATDDKVLRPLPGPANLAGWRETRKRLLGSTDWQTLETTANGAIQKSLLTTRGDMIYRNATVPARLAVGTNGTLLSSNGTDPAYQTKAALNVASLNTENQTLAGGVTVTSKDLGTITTGTLTLDMGDRPQQHYVNGGAHTLAPGTVVGSCLLDITNNASAGAITTSGWTFVGGDSLTTTDGDAFRCHASVGSAGSLLVVQALQ